MSFNNSKDFDRKNRPVKPETSNILWSIKIAVPKNMYFEVFCNILVSLNNETEAYDPGTLVEFWSSLNIKCLENSM